MFRRIHRLGLIIGLSMLLGGCTKEGGESVTIETDVTEDMLSEAAGSSEEVVHKVNPEVLALYADYRKENPDRNYFTPSTENIDGVEYTLYTNDTTIVKNTANREICFSDGECENTIKIDYINKEFPYLEVYGCDLTGDGIEEIICHWDGTGSNLGGDRMLVIDSDTLEEIPYTGYSQSRTPSLSREYHNWFNMALVYLGIEDEEKLRFNCDIVDGRIVLYRPAENYEYVAGVFLEYSNGMFVQSEKFAAHMEDGEYRRIEIPDNLAWESFYCQYYWEWNEKDEYHGFDISDRIIDGKLVTYYDYRDENVNLVFWIDRENEEGCISYNGKLHIFSLEGEVSGLGPSDWFRYVDVTGDGKRDFIYYWNYSYDGYNIYRVFDVETMEEYAFNTDFSDIINSLSIEARTITGDEETGRQFEYEIHFGDEIYYAYERAWQEYTLEDAKEICFVSKNAWLRYDEKTDIIYAYIYLNGTLGSVGAVRAEMYLDDSDNCFKYDEDTVTVFINKTY